MKNKLQYLLVLAAAAAVVGIFANKASAQGFDPAAFRERQLKDARDHLDVKSDEDWDKKIEPLVVKVLDAQRDVGRGGFGLGFGRGNRGGGGGNDQGGGNRGRGGAQANPDREALQKAIEDKAPMDDIKGKLAKFRDSRKAKETALEKAQDDLRKALSPRQEAGAVLAGLIR